MEIMGNKPLEQDYRFWMVVNPATWLMPILFTVLAIVLVIHVTVLSLGWFTFG
jgi:hypothetical protein